MRAIILINEDKSIMSLQNMIQVPSKTDIIVIQNNSYIVETVVYNYDINQIAIYVRDVNFILSNNNFI